MYDEQIREIKADSPKSSSAKESISPTVLPHVRVVKRFVFIFISGKSFVSLTNNAMRVTSKTQNRLDTA